MLEFFVPSFLQETDQYWKYDAFDDVLPTTIEKTGEGNLELRGKGLLFSTCRYVPLNFYVELIADKTRIAVCECQGGYSREHGGRRFHALYKAVNDPT